MFLTQQIKLPPNPPTWTSGQLEPENQGEVRELRQIVISLSERLSRAEYEISELKNIGRYK